MSFFEARFPDKIAFGATGGPEHLTRIITLGSGFEQRDKRWAVPRRTWNVTTGLKNAQDVEDLLGFHDIVDGRFRGFRFKDWLNFKTVPVDQTPTKDDQLIGTGDGAQKEFQLVKESSFGVTKTTRIITKPRPETVLIAKAGVLQTVDTDYVIDAAQGIIIFIVAPPGGEDITWGGEFDVPVRFDIDKISLSGKAPNISRWEAIPIIEIRPADLAAIALNIDFFAAAEKTNPDSRITYTRSGSAAYFFGSDDLIKFASTNQMQIDEDPLSPNTNRGLRVESATTRLNSEPRDLADGTQWAITNATAARDAVGLDGVSNTASTLTATAANGTATDAITAAVDDYTTQFWVKRLTGTGVVEITNDNFTGVVDITSLINSSDFTLVSITSNVTNPTIGVRLVTSGDAVIVDFIGLEQGKIRKSPVFETVSDRFAPTISFNDTGWLSPDGGEIRLEVSIPRAPVSGETLGVFTLYDASDTTRRITFLKDGTTNKLQVQYNDGTGTVNFDDTQAWVVDTTKVIAFKYKAGSQSLRVGGVIEATNTKAVPTGLDTILIGRADPTVSGQPYFDGHIGLVRFLPEVISV